MYLVVVKNELRNSSEKELSTSELIQQCLNKDASAQREFVEKYGKKIMQVCHRYSTLTVEPLDIFQESFIQVFSVLHQFDEQKGQLEGWLYRISVNVALKLIKKNARYDQATAIEDVHGHDDLITEVNDSLGYKELLSFIKQLPEPQRTIFNLYVIDGYDHSEIGERLGISSNASRSHLSRAKTKIKELHNAYNHE